MLPYLKNPQVFDQIIRLSQEEIEKPLLVFQTLFEDYRLSELRHYLWQMTEICLTSESHVFNEAEERADLIVRYQEIEKVLEAGYALVKRSHY